MSKFTIYKTYKVIQRKTNNFQNIKEHEWETEIIITS
jgi:hypothetical protein